MGWRERLQRDWWRPGLTPLTALLLPLTGLVRAATALDRRRRPPVRGPVPVIVVGNLIVGGAGKTPTVIALVRALQAHGHRPGIVSRGYGRRADGVLEVQPGQVAADAGDEPLLMALRTRVPVMVCRDRPAAALALCRRHPEVDVLISDDGLQHHRLARDLELIVFDERGAGNGRLLPAGPLREPLSRVGRHPALVLYNAPAPSTVLPGLMLSRRLAGAVSLRDWWTGVPAAPPRLQALRGRPVLAAAGMAHPQRFFDMLRGEGLDIRPLPLPDHHPFDTLPWPTGTAEVLVTEKDAVKLRPDRVGETAVWVVALDLSLPEAVIDRCLALLPDGPAAPSSS